MMKNRVFILLMLLVIFSCSVQTERVKAKAEDKIQSEIKEEVKEKIEDGVKEEIEDQVENKLKEEAEKQPKDKVKNTLQSKVKNKVDTENKEEERAKLTANRIRYKKDENLYLAYNNVHLDYDSNKVDSDKLKLDRNENIADFSGNVYLQRGQGDEIYSNKLKLDLDRDILVAKEDVKLDSTKKDKPLDLTSQYLKIWTDTNDMLAKDDVLVDYDGQHIKGQRLDYNDEKEEMVVSKEVELKEDGQILTSDKVTIYIEEGDFDALGNVEMEFDID